MPKKVMDYSNTYFYKTVCKNLSIKDCYVGHTTNFVKRKCTHKNNIEKENGKNYNQYVYRFIRENGGWINFEMVLISNLKCENRLEASMKERTYKEQLKATLNQINPIATDEDRLEQAEKYNEWKKEDRKQNPDKYKERDKAKYEKFSDKMKENARERYWLKMDEINEARKDKYHNHGGKEKNSIQCKKYREEHKEEVKLMMKNWYNNTKEEIVCECGQKILNHNLPRHITRRKHQAYLNAIQQPEETPEQITNDKST